MDLGETIACSPRCAPSVFRGTWGRARSAPLTDTSRVHVAAALCALPRPGACGQWACSGACPQPGTWSLSGPCRPPAVRHQRCVSHLARPGCSGSLDTLNSPRRLHSAPSRACSFPSTSLPTAGPPEAAPSRCPTAALLVSACGPGALPSPWAPLRQPSWAPVPGLCCLEGAWGLGVPREKALAPCWCGLGMRLDRPGWGEARVVSLSPWES